MSPCTNDSNLDEYTSLDSLTLSKVAQSPMPDWRNLIITGTNLRFRLLCSSFSLAAVARVYSGSGYAQSSSNAASLPPCNRVWERRVVSVGGVVSRYELL